MLNIRSLTVAFFVIGNIIGSGFFMIPTLLAPLGSNLIYSWTITTIIALTFSFIFGRLYIIFPNSSLVNDYYENVTLKKALAIIYWLSCIIGNVAVFIALIANLHFSHPLIWGGIILFLITYTNHHFDYDTIAKIEILLSFIKFTLLILIPLILFFFKFEMFTFPTATGSVWNISKIGISSLWCFLGIETAAIFASGKDAKNGLILGVTASALLYVALSLFIVGCVPFAELNSDNIAFVLLAKHAGFPNLEVFLSMLISFTIFVSLYGWVASTAKMAVSFTKDNLFPKEFAKLSPSGCSQLGLWSSSIFTYLTFLLINLMNFDSQFGIIADLCVSILLLIYIMYAIALWRASNKILDKIISIIGILLAILSLYVSNF